jgi:dTDP-4-dehydrorhamnose reductase
VKVLITGASGHVGAALVRSSPAVIDLRALSRAELNIADEAEVNAAVAAFRPDLIINAAAYAAVDTAESEPDTAHAINAAGPRHLARAAYSIPGCRMLHISTDYVFDGEASKPYSPGDTTNPRSVYGCTKLLGENEVLAVLGSRAVVLRTGWVYAARGKNCLLRMLRLMREHDAVRVVSHRVGTPTSADSIARALWALARRPDTSGVHWTDAPVGELVRFRGCDCHRGVRRGVAGGAGASDANRDGLLSDHCAPACQQHARLPRVGYGRRYDADALESELTYHPRQYGPGMNNVTCV